MARGHPSHRSRVFYCYGVGARPPKPCSPAGLIPDSANATEAREKDAKRIRRAAEKNLPEQVMKNHQQNDPEAARPQPFCRSGPHRRAA